MNRHYTKDKYLELARRLRDRVPGISITTDIIVGFPGETEEDFEETMDVVRKVRFESAFTFLYSKRTGTRAASMQDQVPESVAKDRFDRLLELVRRIGEEESGKLTGRCEKVLVEELNRQDPAMVTGRLSDNTVVHFPGNESLIGEIVPVRLLESKGFYYIGARA